MKALHIYNSFTREKEEFKSVNPAKVGMYVCGPTVYGHPHLGHARSAITFDIVFRYLSYLEYKVRYVRNITDVGHLEDELAGAGEDKIAKKARLEQLEPMEVAQTYTNSYHHAMDQLNVLRPSIEPLATGHIPEQIKAIENAVAAGYAYEKNGSVYFNLEKFAQEKEYGGLSGKVLEDLQVGSRDTEGLDEKEHPHDFALWKKADPKHIMKWDSPWGLGFPGWHIECTAMSHKYLGFPFDIHGGGMDLQFPHHEAEIAQAQACFHEAPANYWMHNNMLTINGQKMAKSKGNFINLDEMLTGKHDLLEQAYSPMTIRFFMLQANYRSTVDFSNEALQAAEKGYHKLLKSSKALQKMSIQKTKNLDDTLDAAILRLLTQFEYEMNDDFNTAKAIAVLFELSSYLFQFENKQLSWASLSKETQKLLLEKYPIFIHEVLGLKSEEEGSGDRLDAVVNLLISQRKDAREAKDFALSDKIRDDLAEIGIVLKDSKEGTTYELE